jgi:hypothetical protein
MRRASAAASQACASRPRAPTAPPGSPPRAVPRARRATGRARARTAPPGPPSSPPPPRSSTASVSPARTASPSSTNRREMRPPVSRRHVHLVHLDRAAAAHAAAGPRARRQRERAWRRSHRRAAPENCMPSGSATCQGGASGWCRAGGRRAAARGRWRATPHLRSACRSRGPIGARLEASRPVRIFPRVLGRIPPACRRFGPARNGEFGAHERPAGSAAANPRCCLAQARRECLRRLDAAPRSTLARWLR